VETGLKQEVKNATSAYITILPITAVFQTVPRLLVSLATAAGSVVRATPRAVTVLLLATKLVTLANLTALLAMPVFQTVLWSQVFTVTLPTTLLFASQFAGTVWCQELKGVTMEFTQGSWVTAVPLTVRLNMGFTVARW
jgi:hypothetical protein